MDRWVLAEIDERGEAIRIFRTVKDSIKHPAEVVRRMLRADAVASIRRKVYDRANAECEWCSARLTWSTGEMHETRFRGNGGEVSVENCVFLCHGCHTGRPDSAHGNRRWHSSRVVAGKGSEDV